MHTPSDTGAADTLAQQELDDLLRINGLLDSESNEGGRRSIIDEIQDAILDSGRLSITEWRALRSRLAEIERLVPHIDLIIKLKTQREHNPH